MDYFAIVTGVASLYGAYESWRQRMAAGRERAAAAVSEASARAASNAAIDSSVRMRGLLEGLDARRRLDAARSGCRRADDAIRQGTHNEARGALLDTLSEVSHVSSATWSAGLASGSTWLRLRQILKEVIDTLNVIGTRGPNQDARKAAAAKVVDVMIELDEISAKVTSKIGVGDAHP